MSFRNVLWPYIAHPEKYPEEVLSYDDDFVLMKDAFPKSLYHWLLLPRQKEVSRQNPLTQFAPGPLRERAQELIDEATERILKLLKDVHGIEEDELFVRAGFHAVPTMNHIHVHIITQDFCGDRLKNRPHYNSFATEFFVLFDDVPLTKHDSRMDRTKMETEVKKQNLVCHNCGRNFGNKFAQLKSHLHEEFKTKYGVKPGVPNRLQ